MQNNTFFGYYGPSTVIVLDKISSTNDYAKKLLSNFKPQNPFTAIMAKIQTNGRGQRGTTWNTTPYKNMTASYIYLPEELPVQQQFQITVLSSLAIYDVLTEYIPQHLSIKWPNDIMVNNKKIAGILIENKINNTNVTSSIIGVGINVFTTEFPAAIAQSATSIQIEKPEFNGTIIDLVTRIQHKLAYYDKILKNGNIATLWNLYSERLFRKNIPSKFLIDNKEIEGTILGVNQEGYLIVKTEESTNKYDLKGIKCLL